MMTFDEAMGSVRPGEQCNVLLGNGFSQAWNADIFNYQSLFEQADFGPRDGHIRAVFHRFGTFDFEAVMLRMQHAAEILQIYGGHDHFVAQLRGDADSLKEALLRAIAATHPEVPDTIAAEQYRRARQFLYLFDRIFSLNYDLLLYWARNKPDIEPKEFESDDGFRAGLQWRDYDTEQNVFFLHGGLHIYDTSTAILKHAYTEDGDTIIDQVRANLAEDKFPLFVSEPTSEKKLAKIEHNPYLQYGFNQLRNSTGAMFIYGHSIDESDRHVFAQIKSSRLNKVFVSIYGDPASDSNERSQANARAFMHKPGLTVDFFDAGSVPIWN